MLGCAPHRVPPLSLVWQLDRHEDLGPEDDLGVHALLLLELHTGLTGLFARGRRRERCERGARDNGQAPYSGSEHVWRSVLTLGVSGAAEALHVLSICT